VLQDASPEGTSQAPHPASLPTTAHLNAENPNELRLSLPPASLRHSVETRLSAHSSRQRFEKTLSISTDTTTLASVNAAVCTITPAASQNLPPASPIHINAKSSDGHGSEGMPLAVSTERNPPPQQQQQGVKAAAVGVPDTFDMSHTGASLLPVPAADASISQRLDFMHQQLDSLGMEVEALPGLVLLGSGVEERFQGGAVTCGCYCNCNCC
jgi:hypothetical protein